MAYVAITVALESLAVGSLACSGKLIGNSGAKVRNWNIDVIVVPEPVGGENISWRAETVSAFIGDESSSMRILHIKPQYGEHILLLPSYISSSSVKKHDIIENLWNIPFCYYFFVNGVTLQLEWQCDYSLATFYD